MRAYRKEDGRALLELFRRTVRQINVADYSAEQVAAWASEDTDVGEWSKRLEGSFTVVTDCDGTLVGFASLTAEGRVDHAYVAADRQRQGVGGRLVKNLLLEARRRGLTRVTAYVSITPRSASSCSGCGAREQGGRCA